MLEINRNTRIDSVSLSKFIDNMDIQVILVYSSSSGPELLKMRYKGNEFNIGGDWLFSSKHLIITMDGSKEDLDISILENSKHHWLNLLQDDVILQITKTSYALVETAKSILDGKNYD